MPTSSGSPAPARAWLSIGPASRLLGVDQTRIVRVVDYYWMVAPEFHESFSMTLLDVALPIAIGGIFLTLYAVRLRFANPDDSVVLADVISKEPLGPMVRQGDEQWFNIVRWTLFALINAEELQITAAGADELMATAKKPNVLRLLGAEGTLGAGMGLDAFWALRAVKAVGNYGEIFERNLGKDTPLAIDRGINALWNAGGLLYAPPVR